MPANDEIVAILLAAGSAQRFGSDKLLHELQGGMPVAAQSARHLKAAFRQAGARVIAVVRPGSPLLMEVLAAEGCHVVVCQEASSGMGRSLALGVRECGPVGGYVVALADMPFIDLATICAVRDAVATGVSIAAPTYRGRRGHPIGFSSRHEQALLSLTGDEGARRMVAENSESIHFIPVENPGILQDIDTPHDLPAHLP